MRRMNTLLGIILTLIISMSQVGGVFAAPASQDTAPIQGKVERITLETDPNSGITTVIVELLGADQVVQTIRVSQESARVPLGLIVLDEDGNPVINPLALGTTIEVDPTLVIPAQEKAQHPVASALATFFADVEGLDYDMIMSAHENGIGFGVIAQALWLTSELGGDAQLFQDLLDAKQNNNYSAFSDFTEDGTAPKNWGQLKKALLSEKGLGVVISNHGTNNGNHGTGNGNSNANGNGSGNGNSNDKNNDKNSNNNGHGNENGNGNGNGHNK
jgi:hypothetical protein